MKGRPEKGEKKENKDVGVRFPVLLSFPRFGVHNRPFHVPKMQVTFHLYSIPRHGVDVPIVGAFKGPFPPPFFSLAFQPFP